MDDATDGENGGQLPGRSRRSVLATAGSLAAALVGGCGGSGAGSTGSATGNAGGGATTPTGDGTGSGTRPAQQTTGGSEPATTPAGTGTPTETGTPLPTPTGLEPKPVQHDAWRSVELEAVRRDGTFTVDSFSKPVVVETFAVWCPLCTRQQRRLARLDDSVVRVSLNVDPNEDAAKVRRHANSHGFDWRYAVAPPEMTKSLVAAFGPAITNAPSTPIVVACPDGRAAFTAGEITGAPVVEATARNC